MFQTCVAQGLIVVYTLFRGFLGGSVVKSPPANAENAGDTGSIPRWGRSPEGRNGNPLQYSCLENPMDGGAWWAAVHGVTKRWIQLSEHACTLFNFTLSYCFEFRFLNGEESACSAGDLSSIPGSGRPPGEGNGNPLQYSCLENPMDREAWRATVHEVPKSQTRLSDETTTRVKHPVPCHVAPWLCLPSWSGWMFSKARTLS